MDPYSFWEAAVFKYTYRVLSKTALLENEPADMKSSERYVPEGLTFDLHPSPVFNTLTRPRQIYEPMEVDEYPEPVWLLEDDRRAQAPAGPAVVIQTKVQNSSILRPSRLLIL